MIVIYEQDDLNAGATDRPHHVPPDLSDVDPDKTDAAGYAETVYVARVGGGYHMIKARNAPLDPYPVTIKVERAI